MGLDGGHDHRLGDLGRSRILAAAGYDQCGCSQAKRHPEESASLWAAATGRIHDPCDHSPPRERTDAVVASSRSTTRPSSSMTNMRGMETTR